jgi:hypothetical protein
MKTLLLRFIAGLSPIFLLMLGIQTSGADSATWKVRPFNVDWNTAENWRPMTVPNGPADTATFHFSKITGIFVAHSQNPQDDNLTEVNGIVFESSVNGASAYTITLGHPFELRIGSGGITNNSGLMQTFITEAPAGLLPGQVTFNQGATPGNLTAFFNNSPPVQLPGGARWNGVQFWVERWQRQFHQQHWRCYDFQFWIERRQRYFFQQERRSHNIPGQWSDGRKWYLYKQGRNGQCRTGQYSLFGRFDCG